MTDSPPTPVSIDAGGRTYKTPFAAALPPRTAEERRRLTADIWLNGIKVPVLVTEDDEVLDGHHRLAIAAELGLAADRIPIRVESGLTAAEKRHLATTLNTHRRHLTREQVRATITDLLAADPRRSDRAVAGKAGVDHKTVGRVRAKLVAGGALPETDEVRGKDGRTRRRPAAKVKATPTAAEPAVSPAPAEVVPDLLVPATRPDVKWTELSNVAFTLEEVGVAAGRLAKRKVADRSPEPVRGLVQKLAALTRRLEAVAAAQAARASPA